MICSVRAKPCTKVAVFGVIVVQDVGVARGLWFHNKHVCMSSRRAAISDRSSDGHDTDDHRDSTSVSPEPFGTFGASSEIDFHPHSHCLCKDFPGGSSHVTSLERMQ